MFRLGETARSGAGEVAPETPGRLRSADIRNMARPKSNETRDRQLNVALCARELEAVKMRAQAHGLSPVDYARRILLDESGTRFEIPVAAIDRLAFEQMKRIGNNLNQIARQMNALRVPSLDELDEVLRELRDLLRRMG